MKTNKTKIFVITLAMCVLLATLAFAEPKSQRYNQFYPSKSFLSGYATAIPPNTSIPANAIEVQPSTSSSPTFVVKESGYVGIGIPGPQSPLHVKTSAGQLKVSEAGANSVALTVRNNADTGHGSLALNASDYWWQTSGNTRMVLDDQGRLGVGTNSPDSYLGISDERGGTPGFKILDKEGSNAERVQAWVDTAGNSAFRLSDVSGNQQVFLRSAGDSYMNGGNVGIGTQTPQAKLHVNNFGDNIFFGAGNLVYPSAQRSDSYGAIVGRGVSGDFRIALQDGTGRVNYLWNAYTNLTTDSTTNNQLAAVNRYIAAGEPASRIYQGSYGACDPANPACVNTGGGYFVFFGAPAGNSGNIINWVRMGELSSGDKVSFSPRGNDNDFFIKNDGKIGMGTNNPDNKKLHILEPDGRVLRLERTNAPARQWDINIKPTGNFVIGDNTAAADRFAIDANGRVGIGTSVPQAKLHVIKSDIGQMAYFEGKGLRADDPSSYVILKDQDSTEAWALRVGDAGDFAVHQTVKGDRIRISNEGKVFLPSLQGQGKFLCIKDDGTGEVYRSATACQ